MGVVATRYEVAVLDASAIVAAMVGEPAQEEVQHLLVAEDTSNVLVSLNIGEVVDVLIRTGSGEFVDVMTKLDALISAGAITVIPLDDVTSRRAGQLRAEHYHPRERNVSMADCVAVAAADLLGETLATCDPHQAEMAREIGVEVIPLPDSSGQRPL